MTGKVVVITGASSGIGAALALQVGASGDIPVLVARRAELLQETAHRCGGQALALEADLTQRSETRAVVEQTLARLGRIDVWVNNVGRGIFRQPSELTDEDLDEMLLINVKTALYGMQEVLPHFRERGQGHVINVSSLLGRMPYFLPRSAYCAAKHFLNSLTASFREELGETHPAIRVSLVSPGLVYTDFGRNALHGGPDSRGLQGGQSAEDVAAVIAGVIASPRDDVYTRPGSRQQVLDYYSRTGEDA
jgi:NAD(P)-dependent dehydrogenase (short-subunit alcohol dehydrogenase family)